MKKSEELRGVDQEKSTARTESRASNPRRRTNAERRKEFLRAMRMLERIALTQTDYAYPAVAESQLSAARGRVLELFDEAIGYRAKR